MTNDFWTQLGHRICRELAGFTDPGLRSLWCDGLIPETYDVDGDPPRIDGVAFCGHTGQERWRFTLLLAHPVAGESDVDWPALLPADDVTGWLSPHLTERTLTMDPTNAYPD